MNCCLIPCQNVAILWMSWMALSRGTYTQLLALLAVPNLGDRRDLGGIPVSQPLGTPHVSGTGSGSAAAGLLQQLSRTATAMPDGCTAEPAERPKSPSPSRRRGYSASCAANGTVSLTEQEARLLRLLRRDRNLTAFWRPAGSVRRTAGWLGLQRC